MYVSKYHIYLNIRITFIWDKLIAPSSIFEKMHVQNELIFVCMIIRWLHDFRHGDSTVLDMFTKMWKAAVWHTLDGFSWNFLFGDFFENLLKKFKFDYNLTRIMGTLHEDICIFMISCRMLLRKRNVSDKSCRENQNIRFVFNNFFLKIVPFMRQYAKICQSQRGHRWQYKMVHVLGMLHN
jgi:hypothetical protein